MRKITEDHVKLVSRLNLQWQNCEYGAPEVDPKRPYGNSDVENDIREILGKPEMSDERCAVIHEELLGVLQLVISRVGDSYVGLNF
jgi:hypothetical protein